MSVTFTPHDGLFGAAVKAAAQPVRLDRWKRLMDMAAQIGAFRRFFFAPTDLNDEQRLLLEHLQLRELARRTIYWLGALVTAWIAVSLAGIKGPSLWPFIVWTVSLIICTSPFGFLLYKVVHLPTAPISASRTAVRRLHVTWCVWLTIVAIIWLSGAWTLAPQPVPYGASFILARQTFVYLTIIGQIFTIICLSPSLPAVLSVVALGNFLAFNTPTPFSVPLISQILHDNPDLSGLNINIFFNGQLLIFFLCGWFMFFTQKRLGSEWARAESEKERANNFIMTVGHDLKQPLQATALRLELLKKRVRATPDILDGVEELQRQNEALAEIVHASFDLSRLESGTWTVHIQTAVLSPIVNHVVDEFRTEARKKKLTLELLPVPAYLVRTDKDALSIILRNLIGNAIKYTPATDSGRVVVACQVLGDVMSISVEDNGIGIPSDRIGDIFTPYVQLGNPGRDQSKGFGLGLSIVDRLTKLLKGHELKVGSTEGRGSRFSIQVPIATPIPAELLSGGDEQHDPDLRDMTIVLIEDSQPVRDLMCEELIDLGCYVIDGKSGGEVIAKLRDEGIPSGPHLILADYRLEEGTAPGAHTGLDAIADVRRELAATIPAAIWTAESAPELLRRIDQEGIELFPKPAGERALLTLLDKYAPKTRAARNTPAVADLSIGAC
jgi:signal transduction histidine kinase/CheY-like chemotaxis protein